MAAAALDIGTVLLTFGAGLIAALAGLLLLEVVASFLPARNAIADAHANHPNVAVLIPAHNEALMIQATLHKIRPELSPQDRLIVVADNCSDQTGPLAQQAGAEVIYRNQPELRGKGYALDFGVRHLESDSSGIRPDVVIVMDADCWSEPGALTLIAAAAHRSARPVQAFYDLEAPPSRSSDNYLSVASLAWSIKNFVRPLGLHRLGLPCQLMGTGMAFPWAVIAEADLQTPNIVEDLALGLDLASSGKAARFLPAARVVSHFPVSVEGQQTQRTRWEAGHVQMIFGSVPAHLLKALRRANRDLFVLAADAAVPPLTLYLTWAASIFVLSLILAGAGGSLLPLGIAAAALLAIGTTIFLAATRVGRFLALLGVVGRIPGYAASKIAIYKGAFSGKTISWNRSKRD